jgi:hypothetical protein
MERGGRAVTGREDETFLERWLRRKSGAAAEDGASSKPDADGPVDLAADDAGDPGTDDAATSTAARPAQDAAADAGSEDGAGRDEDDSAPPERPITDADLPDLAELDEDSDYSIFMAAGVSPDKRRAALRQLFRSPKFNVIDGLDDYCEDYTKFDPLGSIVTAEMRHHAERLLRKTLEDQIGEPDDAAVASPAPDDEAGAPPDALAAGDREADEDSADEGQSGEAKPEDRSKTRDA